MTSLSTKQRSFLFSTFVFVICFIVGLFLSAHKLLWNDEIYSQINVIDKHSLWQIITMQFFDGNKSPLFYSLQKIIAIIFQFQFPFEWQKEWFVKDQSAQMIMRLGPNLCTSLLISGIVYYFTKVYSYTWGIVAFIVCLCTPTTWFYFSEARPYALWMCLTGFQIITIIEVIRSKEQTTKLLKRLSLIHILLSLTVVISLIQIVIGSFIVGVFLDRNWRKFVPMTLIPVAICGVTQMVSLHFNLRVLRPMPTFIFDNIPVTFFMLVSVACLLFVFKKNKKDKVFISVMCSFILYVLAAVALIAKLHISANNEAGVQYFEVLARYFVFLSPIGIIGAMYAIKNIMSECKGSKLKTMNGLLLVLGLLIITAIQTYGFVLRWAVYYF
ncbi:MAG: hypothetical protein ACI9E5_000225 [Candidatus Omnitrophota bacterium]|jgi:hypothetical protein